ncbi:FAD-binding oxidoreductase [Alkalinema sp. FACHB-956]|nr:FAD-binding oxidoreductase [Alkalinema sp. FACHB-956]
MQLWDEVSPALQATWHRAIAPQQTVVGVMTPQTLEELSTMVVQAQDLGCAVVPMGQGSKLGWGGLAHSSRPIVFLRMAPFNRVIDHAVGDLTVTVEAGLTLAELQRSLATAGQFLAIDPSYPNHATIGGIIATGDTGALRHRYNSVRDMVLGVTFVRSDGQLVKAGGRVVKNVAGYDLMKLLTGSYGTLGVITQVTLRVYPIPETVQTVVLSGAPDRIGQAAQTLLNSALTPIALDAISARVSSHLQLGDAIALLVRFQSIRESVQEQSQRCVDLATTLGLAATIVPPETEGDLWRRLGECMTPTDQTDRITCKIGMKSSGAIAQLLQWETQLPGLGARLHLGSGLGQLVLPATIRSTQLLAARSICQAAGGFLTVQEAPIALKQQMDIWGERGAALAMMQAIKQQFDPQRLFSPGRFIGGI